MIYLILKGFFTALNRQFHTIFGLFSLLKLILDPSCIVKIIFRVGGLLITDKLITDKLITDKLITKIYKLITDKLITKN